MFELVDDFGGVSLLSALIKLLEASCPGGGLRVEDLHNQQDFKPSDHNQEEGRIWHFSQPHIGHTKEPDGMRRIGKKS